MYFTAEDRLKDLTVSDLLKIYNSNKEYIFFGISEFNIDSRIRIILTNNYDKYSKYIVNVWTGSEYIMENNEEVFYTVEEILCKKFLSDDLSKLSKFKFNQLKKIYNNNNNKY